MRLFTYIGLLGLVLPIIAAPIPHAGDVSIPDGSLGTRELHTRDGARITLTPKPRAGEELEQLTEEKIKRIFKMTQDGAYTSVENGDGSWTLTFNGGKISMEAAMHYRKIDRDKAKWDKTIDFKPELY